MEPDTTAFIGLIGFIVLVVLIIIITTTASTRQCIAAAERIGEHPALCRSSQ